MNDSTQVAAQAAAHVEEAAAAEPTVRPAWFAESLTDDAVACLLCANGERLEAGERCPCGTRQNREGTLVTTSYGRLIACNADAIEKRGLFHFHPGASCLSYGCQGCNLRCQFCSNWNLSQSGKESEVEPAGEYVPPETVAELAEGYGCRAVAAAYTEPTVFFEYAFDVAQAARARGLLSVWVTNGQLREQPLLHIAPLLDAVHLDLKCFCEQTYQELCQGHLKPVLDNLERLLELGVHVEVATPLIPGINDGDDELRALTKHLASMSVDLPWHADRFHPDYRMSDFPTTPTETLRRAGEIGREAGLRFVYSAAIGTCLANTYCPECNALLFERLGSKLTQNRLVEGACPDCRAGLPGLGLN